MLALKLDDSWRQIDLGGGLLQNRGPTTIEVAEETTLPQVAYSLLAYNEILSADKWGGDTVYLRKSQTASGDSAIVVVPNNATNELAAIQQIFEETDNGALFDFATIDDLYQNPAATTAAAVGSPVGAMLDVSRGLEINPTNLAEGTVNYSDATKWTRSGSTFSTVDPDNGVNAGSIRFMDVVRAKTYKIVLNFTKTSAAGDFILYRRTADNASLETVLVMTASGTYTVHTTALISSADATNNGALVLGGLFARGSITVTIQEIKGSHAFQATTANMPTLRRTPTTERYWLESIDTARSLNITTATPYNTMYVGRVTPEGMVWTTENWSTTTVNVLGGAGSYSAGYVARGREFTVAEKALIEAYFARQLPAFGPDIWVDPADVSASIGGFPTIDGSVYTAKRSADNTIQHRITTPAITSGKTYFFSATFADHPEGFVLQSGIAINGTVYAFASVPGVAKKVVVHNPVMSLTANIYPNAASRGFVMSETSLKEVV